MTYVNQEVDVNAFYFAGKELKSYPRQISFGGRAVTFADGLRVSLAQNGRLTYLFNMRAESGEGVYCLRQDGSQWTLVGTR
jgi:hypothetical protein